MVMKSVDFIKRKTLFELNSRTGAMKSLAIDWINNHLYYSYIEGSRAFIKVTNFPSIDYHYTIFNSKIEKPSLLAVNPKLKFLYWIDQVKFNSLIH